MSDPTPTVTTNAAAIATLIGDIKGLASDVQRVERDAQAKDSNLWGTVNRILEELNRHGKVNWPLIVAFFSAILGSLTLILSVVVLYTKNTVAPIEQRLIEHESRIGLTWAAQGKITDRITANENAAAYAKGRQDVLNERIPK